MHHVSIFPVFKDINALDVHNFYSDDVLLAQMQMDDIVKSCYQ